jgi:hypothetical protein
MLVETPAHIGLRDANADHVPAAAVDPHRRWLGDLDAHAELPFHNQAFSPSQPVVLHGYLL